MEIDFAEFHASARHKLFLERRFPSDIVGIVQERVDQAIAVLFAQVYPRLVGVAARSIEEVGLEFSRKVPETYIPQFFLADVGHCLIQCKPGVVLIWFANPIDLGGEVIIAVC